MLDCVDCTLAPKVSFSEMSKRKRTAASHDEDSSVPTKKIKLPNQDIIDILVQLGNNEKTLGQRFKSVAYFKAANTLKKLDYRVQSGTEAMKLSGIGKAIGKKIDEILETGTLEKLTRDENKPELQSVKQVMRIFGITSARANEITGSMKIASLKDLRDDPSVLNEEEKLALQFVEDFEEKILRREAEYFEGVFKEIASQVDPDLEIYVCGDSRRESSDIFSLQVLVSHSTLKTRSRKVKALTEAIVQEIHNRGLCTAELKRTKSKISLACVPSETVAKVEKPKKLKKEYIFRIPTIEEIERELSLEDEQKGDSSSAVQTSFNRLVEIRWVGCDKKGVALIMCTGPQSHLDQLKLLAESKGFSWTDFTIKKEKKMQELSSEEDVYDLLEIPFVKPSYR